jgi:hypothetical protein
MTGNVHEELVLLRAQVDYLLGRLADADGLGASPVAWCALDREQARQEWASLAGWVDWLIDRYGLTETIPACWYRHPAVLEELSALRCGWLGAFEDPTARAADGVTWHDMLERVMARIREWDRSGCAAGRHRDDVTLTPDPRLLDARCAFIRDDTGARPAPEQAHQPPDNLTLL